MPFQQHAGIVFRQPVGAFGVPARAAPVFHAGFHGQVSGPQTVRVHAPEPGDARIQRDLAFPRPVSAGGEGSRRKRAAEGDGQGAGLRQIDEAGPFIDLSLIHI